VHEALSESHAYRLGIGTQHKDQYKTCRSQRSTDRESGDRKSHVNEGSQTRCRRMRRAISDFEPEAHQVAHRPAYELTHVVSRHVIR
jgi:hypothetical protein